MGQSIALSLQRFLKLLFQNVCRLLPISFCNIVYKLTSKIIKTTLSKCITKAQFGFLEHRLIQDAVVIAQLCIHSTKVKKKHVMLMKLDLMNAYECMDWIS